MIRSGQSACPESRPGPFASEPCPDTHWSKARPDTAVFVPPDQTSRAVAVPVLVSRSRSWSWQAFWQVSGFGTGNVFDARTIPLASYGWRVKKVVGLISPPSTRNLLPLDPVQEPAVREPVGQDDSFLKWLSRIRFFVLTGQATMCRSRYPLSRHGRHQESDCPNLGSRQVTWPRQADWLCGYGPESGPEYEGDSRNAVGRNAVVEGDCPDTVVRIPWRAFHEVAVPNQVKRSRIRSSGWSYSGAEGPGRGIPRSRDNRRYQAWRRNGGTPA